MKKMPSILLMGLFCMLLSGCAFVSIPLLTSPEALKERVLEGKGKDKILLIEVSGVISEGRKSSLTGLTEEVPLLARIREELQMAEQDPSIAALIVRITSPGGSITASDAIYHELSRYKKNSKARVLAYILGTGASGGYYIAAAADEIWANPTAITGSISAIAMKLNVQGLMDKIGVASETIKSGDKKDLWSPFRPSTPEEKAIMQTLINQFHNRFVDVVAEGRKAVLTREQIGTLADGRIYSAQQALAAKLIDRIGYLDEALARLKETLNLREAKVIAYSRPGAFRGTVYSHSAVPAPQVVNLFSIGGDLTALIPEVHFMYLWNP